MNLDWNNDSLVMNYYRGFKDWVKDEVTRQEKPTTLIRIIHLAQTIDKRS